MEILVLSIPLRKVITLQVESSDTVRNVKSMIQEKEGIPSYRQILFLNEQQLVDSFTLDDFYIRNDTVLRLVLKSKEWMYIFVNVVPGLTIGLEVESTDTIRDLRVKIRGKVSVPLDRHRPFFDGKELYDDGHSTLSDFGVKHESTLDLLLKLNRPPFINTVYNGTIGNVKGETKNEDQGGKKGSFGSKGLMRITLTNRIGTTICKQVESSYTVGGLRAKILKEEGLPLDNHSIFFRGEQLQDNRTFADYNIHDDTTLNLVRRY